MPGDPISPLPASAPTGVTFRLRFLACCAAMAATAGALWAALAGAGCGECHQAGALLPGIPLAWIGVAFYATLAAETARAGLSRWTRSGFLAASGAHLGLLSLLAWEHIFCGRCLLTAAAALTGGLVSLAVRPRSGRWAAIKVAAALLATFGTIMTVRHLQRQAPQLPGDQAPAPVPTGHVRLVLYEREGCKHCLQFDEQILPRLKEEFGTTMEIEHRQPAIDMETPTIIVQGKGSREFVGLPEYESLESAIREMQGVPKPD